MKLILKN